MHGTISGLVSNSQSIYPLWAYFVAPQPEQR